MLPLEILLSSIDIGVDRVGSRLPLQGRCACLRLDFGSHNFHMRQGRLGGNIAILQGADTTFMRMA